MRLLIGVTLIIGGLCGAVMGVMCNIVADSSVLMFDGLEISMALALFSVLSFLSGIYNLFLTG